MPERQGTTAAGSLRARAGQVARDEMNRAQSSIHHLAESGVCLYPTKGFFYFLSHRSLWKPLMSRLLPMITLSAGVLTFMFLFTYLPQLAVLALFNGPLAVFTTVLLVLSESSTIISLVARSWVLQDALLDTFDGTLVARGASNVVSGGRYLKPGSDPIQKLGKLFINPFERFSPKAILYYIIGIPLNFIPVVGSIIFVFLQGRARGKAVHARYFQLKNWSDAQVTDWLKKHEDAYTSFGTFATLLEMIPIFGFFCSFTNTVAAALWAADIEANGTEMPGTAPELRDAAQRAE